jgi:hypothetical protein
MEDGVVQAILDANSKLVPARLATGSAVLEGFNVNRHTKTEPKPRDRELAVLRLDDSTGKPLAVLVNFAAHPTMLPSLTLKFSADWAGAMKQAVTAGTGAATIFMQGAAGDQSVDRSRGDYQQYGKALAREVLDLLSTLRPADPPQPSVDVREDRFPFPSRTGFNNPLIQMAFGQAFFPELIANYVDEYAGGVRPRLTVALVHREIALVGASGEFFANHAIRLKERVRVKQIFFFGYSNGYHQYFPTIEGVAEGGYGADSGVSPVAIGAGEQLMNNAVEWIYRMLGKIKQAALIDSHKFPGFLGLPRDSPPAGTRSVRIVAAPDCCAPRG